MNIDYIFGYWFIVQCACVVHCGISVDIRLQPVIDRVLIITTILATVACTLLILSCHDYPGQLPPAYEQFITLNNAYGAMLLFILCSPIPVFLCRQYLSVTRLRLALKLPQSPRAYTFFWLRAGWMAFFIIVVLTLSMTEIINPSLCRNDNEGFIWGGIGLTLALGVHTLCIHAMKKQLCQLAKKH